MSESLALLITDVVDSTRLNDQLGDTVMAPLWAAHDRAARELVRRWRGREIGRSDGFLLLFEHAADAWASRSTTTAACPRWTCRCRRAWVCTSGQVTLRENARADQAQGATPFEVTASRCRWRRVSWPPPRAGRRCSARRPCRRWGRCRSRCTAMATGA